MQTVTLTSACLQAHAPMYINKRVWDESKTPVKYVANPADGERAAALLKVLTGSGELPEMPLSGKEALVTPRSATNALRWSSVVAEALSWLELCRGCMPPAWWPSRQAGTACMPENMAS